MLSRSQSIVGIELVITEDQMKGEFILDAEVGKGATVLKFFYRL
jgi:hypothetical protein